MVFLFNKARIYSYIVAVTTVVVLFVVAANIDTEDMAIQTSVPHKNNSIEQQGHDKNIIDLLD